MSILDTLLNSTGGGTVERIGQQLGLDPATTRAVVGQLMPALSEGIERNAASNGLDQLRSALSNGDHARYLDDPSALQHARTIDDGNAILGHIFGSKDVSRNVAAHTASETGVSADLIKTLLPIVAAAAMGALSKKTDGGATLARPQDSGGGLDLLAGLLGSDGAGALGKLLFGGRQI